MLRSASGATNSDSAVVGLQAMHLAAGTERLSPFLWGSHYQTSADSLIAALAFRLFGASPLVLMASSLAGHIALCLFAFGALSRCVPRGRAAILVSLLVMSGAPVNGYALFPPRQLALTLSFAAFYCFAAAQTSKRAGTLAFVGALVATLAVGADPYALIFLPSVAIFAFFSLRHRRANGDLSKHAFALARGGAIVGIVPYVLITTSASAAHGTLGFSPDRVLSNAKLLAWPCLPWALSGVAFTPVHFLEWVRVPESAVSVVGALMLVLLLFLALRRLVRVRFVGGGRETPLATAAWVGMVLTVAGFFGSVMVMDLFSTRYLVSLVLLVPFALAPLAGLDDDPKAPYAAGIALILLLALPLAANALSAFAAYGPFVQTIDRGTNEAALARTLAKEGITHAYSDYWSAYRLTFVTKEQLIVVPTHPAEDRHPEYRAAVAADPRMTYIFDPLRSREGAAVADAMTAAQVPMRVLDPRTTGGFEVIVAAADAAQYLR